MTTRDSTITCPRCCHTVTDTMPADACVFFWRCPACQAITTPKRGDCCVYCSYATVPCPSVQRLRSGATADVLQWRPLLKTQLPGA